MAIQSVDNKRPSADVMKQRINAGTIGGEHAVLRGFTSQAFNSVVDDSDTRILYGTVTGGSASFTIDQGDVISQFNTFTIIGGRDTIGTEGAAAQLRFNGTSIGVLGGRNPYSGLIIFYIDGVETAGRLPTYTTFFIGSGSGASVNAPVLTSSATTILTYGSAIGFPSSGTLLIGSELITYTGISTDGSGNDSFTGCTRGALGTTAVEHFTSESIYVWGSSLDLFPGTVTDFTSKELLYYNPFLSPGEHTITVAVFEGDGGYSRFYFDGFITGSLVGSKNLFTQTGTVTIQVGTDANGHGIIGQLFFNSSDRAVIGILGYTQVGTESSNTTSMAKLGVTRSETAVDAESRLFLYLHNGPASTTVTIVITFSYVGEAI